jgi:hypothetical protein
MSGDVITTIKDNPWLIALILSIFLPSGWGTRGIFWTVLLGRTRRLAYLKRRRDWLQQLHDSDRAYYGWLLSGVLWALMLLGMQLAVEGLIPLHPTWTVEQQYVQGVAHTIERLAMGFAVYSIAYFHLMEDRLLRQHFDRTVAGLDHLIATLEAKQAQHPPAVAA